MYAVFVLLYQNTNYFSYHINFYCRQCAVMIASKTKDCLIIDQFVFSSYKICVLTSQKSHSSKD